MMALLANRTVAGPEYLIPTADGPPITRAPRAIRAAVGSEYLIMAADGGTR
jgi:hypothetical protein